MNFSLSDSLKNHPNQKYILFNFNFPYYIKFIDISISKVDKFQSKFDNVEALCNKTFERDPTFLLTYICMGEGFEAQGELEKALKSFEMYMEKSNKQGQDYPFLLAGKIMDLKEKLKNKY